MKYLLLLIFLIITIKNTFGQKQFINFIPYANDGCYGTPSGIGFSIVTDKCLNDIGSFLLNGEYDYNSYYFYIENGTIYQQSWGQKNCTGPSSIGNYGENYSCVDIPQLISFNSKYQYFNSFVSITNDEPKFPNNSLIFSVYSNGQDDSSESSSNGICYSNNFLFATTISNSLSINFSNGLNSNYTCENGQPTVTTCNSSSDTSCDTISLETTCESTINAYDNIYCTN